MKVHIWVVVTILTMFCSGILSAQGTGIGPVLGYQKASGADEGNLMFGAALRLKFSPAIGAEGSINYRREKYADGLLTVKSWPVMASALLYPLPNVYGVLGGGWYNTTYEFDQEKLPMVSNKTKQEFGWHLGGGIEVPFSPTSRITGDIRYVFIDYDIEEIVGLDDNVKSNFILFTVGLMIGL
jgi:opacity protein-like surface antigen